MGERSSATVLSLWERTLCATATSHTPHFKVVANTSA
jgi:hypothetical protein